MSLAATLPVPNSPAIDLRSGFPTREWYLYWAQPPIQASNITGAVNVAQGGTGLTGGVTGGVLAFTGPETLTSSETLGLGQIVFGGGPGAVPSTPLGTGTSVQFLQGNVKGYPTWATFVAGQNINIEYVNGTVRFSANLSSASLVGIDSVLVSGSLGAGNAQTSLVNDSATPGNTYYYGTGPTGTKGWNTIASTLAAGTNITLSTGSDGVTTINSTASGGVLPMVTGGVQNAQPTFVYFDDGSLMYAEAA